MPMSAQFYTVHPTMVQNAMGGTHLHTPQSIFQHTMSHQSPGQQNEAQWLRCSRLEAPPMSMPWSIPSYQQPDLIRFAKRPTQFYGPIVHQKRKMETPDVVDTRPTKQFITEEKMAQHFRGLHISNNSFNAQPSTSTATSSQSIEQSRNLPHLNLPNLIETGESTSQPKLVISDEIKRLQSEPILPSSLLSKLERPTMALVLWEPPSKHLRILPSRDTPTPIPSDDNNNNGTNSENANNNNNNSESIPNLNQSMDVNISDPTLEPMDL